MNRRIGFTLIEIMIVVFIIGILVAIIGPIIIGRAGDAQIEQAKADIRTIETALNLYRRDNDTYPSSDLGLDALVSNPGEAAAPNWEESYIERLPVDPWGQSYGYVYPGRRGSIDIFSFGADRREGGEGDAADIFNSDI